ncbi:amino acid ABC transporter substrate-binding protein [Desulfobulbus rhabdoformis]|uniref:ABC transporter substrate-binding protein n=1 Tax=Desulfobulbus rhabdoformis TaxID=34032 RepID=UPI001962764B|nr:transporter substrate-binding domain-containing protein [Desulfobulbus rhabdoformis]MBM9613725.1 amino acid ABC transporter substrate-binding protein [Desulfobulbus rhabdoformis]
MKRLFTALPLLLTLITFSLSVGLARDLKDIQREGVLRHLGVPYANFVAAANHGLDVELMRLFAEKLGVRYEYVQTDWKNVISELTGKLYTVHGNDVHLTGSMPIKGDVIANGLTILPWRKALLDYSAPTFPTQVWLIAAANSSLQPITPSGDIEKDIVETKALLADKTVLGISGTCLDPQLYKLQAVNAKPILFAGTLNQLAPAILQGEADTSLLDVADALVALVKWPGQVKILGPVSKQQVMGVGFRKESPELQKAFAQFYEDLKKDGTYAALVKKYYPDVFSYYPHFFHDVPPVEGQ